MSKERLEEIKQYYSKMSALDPGTQEDILWLIEQAERAEELEDRHYRQELIDEHIERLEQQNKRYREVIEYIKYAIYTQHCTKNHTENTEHEKGEISGLIQASNIVDKALRKLESESHE